MTLPSVLLPIVPYLSVSFHVRLGIHLFADIHSSLYSMTF
jgi:hypothetical protein